MVTYSSIITKCRRVIGNDHMILVFLAMIAGGLAGSAVTLFREFIALIQALLFGSTSERLFVNADALAWWKILLVPVVGGLVVGAVVHFLLPQKRPHGVADVIEAAFDKAYDDLLRAGDVARTGPQVLCEDDDLEAALSQLAKTGEDRVAVVDDTDTMIFKGYVTHAGVMAAYNKALLKTRHDEHGE